ncbi:MAG: hypothetical protein HPY85_06340 [Anaerolineae bacterium]|nr:hypothetical protein [Anaerolineae bacterium]
MTLGSLLMLLIVIVPIVSGVVLVVRRVQSSHWHALIWAWEALLLAMMLVVAPTASLILPVSVIPPHHMGVSASTTGIQLLIFLSLAGLLTVYMPGRSFKSNTWQASLSLILFAIAAIVVFSGDFLTRLLALELAAFAVSLYPLAQVDFPLSRRWMRVLEIYIPMRVAGALVIAVFFPLAIEYNMYQIDPLLTLLSGRGAPKIHLVGMLLTSIAIKSGSFPFWKWVNRSLIKSDPDWEYGAIILTSSLGFYLMYRLLPILPEWPITYLLLAFIISLAANALNHFSKQPLLDRPLLVVSQNYPVLLVLLALRNEQVMLHFLMLLIPLMIFISPSRRMEAKRWANVSQFLLAGFRVAVTVFALAGTSLPGLTLILAILILILQITLVLPRRNLPTPVSPIQSPLRLRADLEYAERSVFREFTQSFVDLEYYMDHANRYINWLLGKVSRWLNRQHNGSLDRYLYWTVFLMGCIFAFFLMV